MFFTNDYKLFIQRKTTLFGNVAVRFTFLKNFPFNLKRFLGILQVLAVLTISLTKNYNLSSDLIWLMADYLKIILCTCSHTTHFILIAFKKDISMLM